MDCSLLSRFSQARSWLSKGQSVGALLACSKTGRGNQKRIAATKNASRQPKTAHGYQHGSRQPKTGRTNQKRLTATKTALRQPKRVRGNQKHASTSYRVVRLRTCTRPQKEHSRYCRISPSINDPAQQRRDEVIPLNSHSSDFEKKWLRNINQKKYLGYFIISMDFQNLAKNGFFCAFRGLHRVLSQ